MASFRSIAAVAALLTGSVNAVAPPVVKRALPALAQVIDQKAFNVLPTVLPAEEFNGSSVSLSREPNASVFLILGSGTVDAPELHVGLAQGEAVPRVR
jgi:hypothetical protein